MIHIVDFFTGRFGPGANIIVGIIFLAIAVLGVVIAMRGRGVMSGLVCICGMLVGILMGAMAGILIFDSFIIMLVLAVIGGTALLILVKYVKSLGYFIGMGALGFFLAFTITSEMYITNTRITENTVLLIDLVAGIIIGIMAAVKSKYLVSVITAASGGVMTSVSILALFRFYFSDWKTWSLALVIAVFGMITQIRVYDIRPERKPKKPKPSYKIQNKHSKK